MATYSEKRQYIFFANPQTASKAIALTLRKRLDGVRLPRQEMRRNGEIVVRQHHTTYRQLIDAGLLSEAQLDDLLKVTCIRNPYDQMVSKYLKYCERLNNEPSRYKWLERAAPASDEHSFPEWFAWLGGHYREIDKINTGPMEFIRHADLVIRFEALQDGFDEFLRRIGVSERIPVFEHNVTSARLEADDGAAMTAAPVPTRKKRYTEYYDDRTIEAVSRLYAPVIERFGYRFGE
ncbi:MAG: sulfotransferase family 2 domain-containing protein [Pseudomonadota bacterium]